MTTAEIDKLIEDVEQACAEPESAMYRAVLGRCRAALSACRDAVEIVGRMRVLSGTGVPPGRFCWDDLMRIEDSESVEGETR